MRRFRKIRASAVVAAMVIGVTGWVTGSAQAADPFFEYSGSKQLAEYKPGDVLKSRVIPYHLVGVPTPLDAVQILYRSTDALGQPTANVTSLLKHPSGRINGVISYQSAYDSLNPADSPSRMIAGDFRLLDLTPIGRNPSDGNLLPTSENTILTTVLALGYAVNIADTEGQDANFAAGPEYGMNVLDSLRAISTVAETGASDSTRFGLVGYSGGAIASNWAAILAPEYAADINRRIVGVAQGGVLVNPARNLEYASGSLGWAGVLGMGVVGLARAYDIDFDRYTNDYGKQVLHQLTDASILNAWYPGLTWEKMVKPEFVNPNSVPEFVDTANKINMGTAPIPTVPMFIAQGAGGLLEGTSAWKPGIGPGDGIMIAGDVAALANRYCGSGVPVQYHDYGPLSHVTAPAFWGIESAVWLLDRFADKVPPNNCNQVPPGNPNALAPMEHAKPA